MVSTNKLKDEALAALMILLFLSIQKKNLIHYFNKYLLLDINNHNSKYLTNYLVLKN